MKKSKAWGSDRKMNYIYGPVNSRRLGRSLGVNLTPGRVCSLDCIYCEEARPTATLTCTRGEYAPTKKVIEYIKAKVKVVSGLDFITFSGSGEPTLHSGLGEIISAVKDTGVPIAVLTNSTLLNRADVRKDLDLADLVVPSLDAVSQDVFEKINKPSAAVSAADVVEGIGTFCNLYKGKIWLEVLLVKGINDHIGEVQKIAEIANTLPLEKVHLNTICRTTTVKKIEPVAKDTLVDLKKYFKAPVEIVVSNQ